MRFTSVILGFVVCCGFDAYAQLDSILQLPKDYQIRALWDQYYFISDFESLKDTVDKLREYDLLYAELNEKQEQGLAQQAWLIRQVYRGAFIYVHESLGQAILQEAIKEAHDRGWDMVEAECLMYSGTVYMRHQMYGRAFDNMVRAYNRLKELGFDKNPHTMRHISSMGYAYYAFEDYPTAIQYLRETLTMPAPWSVGGFHRQTLTTIGLCYQRMMQYDSAIHYYILSRDEAIKAKDTFWVALADGNRGMTYILSGKDDEAFPLLKNDYTTSLANKEVGSASNAALELSGIFIRRGIPDSAKYYVESARAHIVTRDLSSMSKYYRNMYEIRKMDGAYQEAMAMADSFHLYRDSMVLRNDIHLRQRVKQQVEVGQYTHEIRMLEAARNRQILLRNAILLIVVLSGGVLALWINQQRLKRRKELELQKVQKQIAEEELRNAQIELNAYTETLRQKNALIDSFSTEMELLRSTPTQSSDARSEQIGALLNATILTEDDWREFRRMFDKVHPAFFGSLKEKVPDLTPADLRLLALTKLKLAPREMMAMLGVSYDAIKKSRKRLLQRLNLAEEESLTEFVESIA